MSSSHSHRLPARAAWFALPCFVLLGGHFQNIYALPPPWWQHGVVLNVNAIDDDYAVVNQGQLMHIAKKAYIEFEAELLGGAGNTLDALWATPALSTDDYIIINIGQLKNTAKPFYDRLAELNYTGQPLTTGQLYPWSGVTATDDYALANVGQVKNLFSFIPSLVRDSDEDGLSDIVEVTLGTDPFRPDTDGDGRNDSLDAYPLDSTRNQPLTPVGGDTTAPVLTLIQPLNAVHIP